MSEKKGYIVVKWTTTDTMASIDPELGKAPDRVKELLANNLLQDLNISVMVHLPKKGKR